MPRYNVEHNGKWAVWTSVADGFLTDLMDVDSFAAWRMREYKYEKDDTQDCIAGKVYFNRQSLHESLMSLGIHQDTDEMCQWMDNNGLSEYKEFYTAAVNQCLKDLDETGGCDYPPPPVGIKA